MMAIIVFFIFMSIGLSSGLSEYQTLPKKYTLRILMILNVGGKVVPTGDVCTESLDLLLEKVNSQRKILKDYNVVVDILDDECSGSRAIRRIIPELENWKTVTSVGYNTDSYVASLPQNFTMALSSAHSIYTLPLLIGGICSGSCKGIARFPQHFNLIETATGCLDASLDNKKRFPNFYRAFKSSRASTFTRKGLIDYLDFSRIAILSDATQYTYNDVTFFISQLSRGNSSVEIAAEEFFQSDPTDALSRLKKQDIRIVFAICYVHKCPAIACAAYNMNYYGPNMVWIFNGEVDLLGKGIRRPPGCNSNMTNKFAEGILHLGTDANSLSAGGVSTELGLSGKQVIDFIGKAAPETFSRLPSAWRMMCFESLHNGINIANGLEEMLGKRGKTLAGVIADPSSKLFLAEELRSAVLNMNYQATWGRAKYGKFNLFSSPSIIIQQVQNLKRVVVLVDEDGELKPFKKNNFIWRTSNGKVPKSKPTLINKAIATPATGLQVSRSLSTLLLFVLAMSLYVLLKTEHYEISVTLFGALLIVISNILYPEDVAMQSKCAIITALLLLGFASILGILCIKLGITFLLRKHDISASIRNTAAKFSFPIWLLVNAVLIIATIAYDKPKEVTIEKEELHEDLAENITIHSWKACTSDGFIVGYVSIGIQSALAVFGIFCGLITHYNSAALLTADIPRVRTCLYIIVPLTAALLMIQLVIRDHLIIFVILNIFSLGTGLAIAVIFALPQVTLVKQQVSVTTSIKPSAYRPQTNRRWTTAMPNP